jgi:drug/metabolite transporter (DMT)-like permease
MGRPAETAMDSAAGAAYLDRAMTNAALYTVTVLIWGMTWYVVTFQLGVVPPEISVGYRFILAGLILLAFCVATRRRLRFAGREHVAFALQGLFIFAINYTLIYFAASRLPTGLIAVVFSTIIVFNILFGALIFRTKVRPQVVLGALFGVAGTALVFAPEFAAFDAASPRFTGIMLSLLAVILASIGNMMSVRNQRAGLPVVQTNAYSMLYSGIAVLAYGLLRGLPLAFDPSFDYVASLLFLAVFATAIAFGGYLTLLGRLGADRAAYIMVLFPIVALAMSTAFEGFHWSAATAGGVALVLLGNLLTLARLPGAWSARKAESKA